MVRTFGTKAAARTWATRTEADIESGRKVNVDRAARFSDLLGRYRELVTMTRPMSRSKTNALEALEKALGSSRVADMNVGTLTRYAELRRRGGAGAATLGQDLSYVGTVLRHGAPMLGIDATHALEALRTARSLLAHAGVVTRSQERIRRPTQAELLRLRDFWQAKPPREIPMWQLSLFAVATAMRLGEILSLEWAGFDRSARVMLIRDRKHPRQKAGNDQRVPLLSGHWKLAGDAIDPVTLIERQPRTSALIFPYRAASVSTGFTRAVQACGIHDLHFHDLRHDGVSRLFEAGYSLEQVALVSGHRDWNQLRRYTQIQPEHVQARPRA